MRAAGRPSGGGARATIDGARLVDPHLHLDELDPLLGRGRLIPLARALVAAAAHREHSGQHPVRGQ
jgi:hypothetical protein